MPEKKKGGRPFGTTKANMRGEDDINTLVDYDSLTDEDILSGKIDPPEEFLNKRVSTNTLIELRYVKKLKVSAISKITGMSQQSIYNRLKPIVAQIKDAEAFKATRSLALTAKQAEILESMDADKIKKASLRDSAIAFGTLYDKERLEEGKSTQNIAYADMVKANQELINEQKALQERMDQLNRGEYFTTEER